MDEKLYLREAQRIFSTETPTQRQLDSVKLATFGHVFQALETIRTSFDEHVKQSHYIFLTKDEKILELQKDTP